MANLKIITHTSYTYETTDGREFDSKPEAEAWQKVLDTAAQLVMLTSKFERTTESESCFNVYAATRELVNTFNELQEDQGLCARITEPGYYYYDEVSDEFVNIDREIERLLVVKALIDNAGI